MKTCKKWQKNICLWCPTRRQKNIFSTSATESPTLGQQMTFFLVIEFLFLYPGPFYRRGTNRHCLSTMCIASSIPISIAVTSSRTVYIGFLFTRNWWEPLSECYCGTHGHCAASDKDGSILTKCQTFTPSPNTQWNFPFCRKNSFFKPLTEQKKRIS